MLELLCRPLYAVGIDERGQFVAYLGMDHEPVVQMHGQGQLGSGSVGVGQGSIAADLGIVDLGDVYVVQILIVLVDEFRILLEHGGIDAVVLQCSLAGMGNGKGHFIHVIGVCDPFDEIPVCNCV